MQTGHVSTEEYYRRLTENISDLIITTDLALGLTYVSPSAERVVGYSAAALKRFYYRRHQRFNGDKTTPALTEFERFLHEEMRRIHININININGSGSAVPLSVRVLTVRHRDGRPLWLEVSCSALRHGDDELAGLLCICRDITERKQIEEELALAAKVFQNSLTGTYITDAHGKIIQVNQAFTRITGYSSTEVVGHSPVLMDVERYAPSFFKSIGDSLERKDYWEGEIQHRHKDGHLFPGWVAMTVLRDRNRNVINTISTFTDITEKKNSETKIQRLAYFDPLCGLPNRSLFNDRLSQALNRARRSKTQVALMFLDLDRFKAINDSLGHSLGDELLQQVARRLSDCVRNEDTVARMGGDEFTIILGGLANRQQAITAAAHVAEKVRHVLAQPFLLQNREIFTSTSIGISFYPTDSSEPQTLLQNADTAMYHAKSTGKNNYQFYTEAMNTRAMERLELENDLHQALHKTQFELFYQPILDARQGRTVGVEALVRWRHPSRGLIMPGDFLGIAEESGLIKPLDTWVLRHACEQLAIWEKNGLPAGRMAVNVSARQFVEGYVLQTLRDVIRTTGINPGHLELELTESALMQDHHYSVEVLESMKRLGVKVSIDDFGTGYSSLTYLKKFPIDTLKVDKSFIEGLPAKEDERIVQAIVALARSLNLKVIAEGVETPRQLEFLRELGCEEVQGFLLSEPVRAERLKNTCRIFK